MLRTAYCEISRRGHKVDRAGQGRAGFHGWSSPRNCTLIPRNPRSTLGSYPDLPTAAPDHSLLRTPLLCTVRKLPRIHPPSPSPCLLPPQGSRLKAQGSACLCLSTTLLLLVSPTDRVLSSCTNIPFFSSYPLHLPEHYHSSYSLLLPSRPPPETLASVRLPRSLSPPHHSTYTLFCPGSADGLGVLHLKVEERGYSPSRGRPSSSPHHPDDCDRDTPTRHRLLD